MSKTEKNSLIKKVINFKEKNNSSLTKISFPIKTNITIPIERTIPKSISSDSSYQRTPDKSKNEFLIVCCESESKNCRGIVQTTTSVSPLSQPVERIAAEACWPARKTSRRVAFSLLADKEIRFSHQRRANETGCEELEGTMARSVVARGCRGCRGGTDGPIRYSIEIAGIFQRADGQQHFSRATACWPNAPSPTCGGDMREPRFRAWSV